MRLTLLSLPLLSLVSPQAVWNTGDDAKFAAQLGGENDTITSAIVSDGVVDLSTGVHYINGNEKGVFHYCTKLETVRLPESLRKIGGNAFCLCKALMHVDIPSGVNEIGEDAFAYSSLETVTIPEGVVNLPDGIFARCKSLKSVKLPSSLKTIGSAAFDFCPALTTIQFGALNQVPTIRDKAFHGACNNNTLCIEFRSDEENVKKFADNVRRNNPRITVTVTRGKTRQIY